MTSQEQLAMQHRLEEVLGAEHAATLITMLPQRDDLATRADLAEFRTELKDEMGVLRSDMAELRTELKGDMAQLRTELRDDMAALRTDKAEFKADVRGEISELRTEMNLKFVTKEDLLEFRTHFDTTIHGFVKTFIKTQAATVVGMSVILFGLVRFF